MHVPSEKTICPSHNNLRKNTNCLILRLFFKDYFIINLSLAFLFKMVLPKSCSVFEKAEVNKTGLASLQGGGRILSLELLKRHLGLVVGDVV